MASLSIAHCWNVFMPSFKLMPKLVWQCYTNQKPALLVSIVSLHILYRHFKALSIILELSEEQIFIPG
jgi:hypothetical protein